MRAALSLGVGATLVVATLLLVNLTGCFGTAADGALASFGESTTTTAGSESTDGAAPTGAGTADGRDESTSGADADGDGIDADVDAAPVDATDISEEPTTETVDSTGAQSGTLTAGSFDDNLNFETFTGFVDEVLATADADQLPAMELGTRIIVRVLDSGANPLPDARVVITPTGTKDQQQQQRSTLLDQTTGSDGRLLFLTGFDGGGDETSFDVQVVYPADGDLESGVEQTFDLTATEWEVTLDGATGVLPSKLDLAFVVDATGSMGDELEYLKTEVQGIAQGVSELFPAVAQRFALIVYRDVGDIYVTRTFDFDTLEEFLADLEAQEASGGGDWPEAMHQALDEALGLSWQTTATARVLFLIADAPPHAEHAQDAFDGVVALRDAGVAIYPVAASGVDTELEFYLRSAAFLTLSEYLFLTDDSGVGNTHAEPHIPCYHVQRLDQLILRMIEAELSGARVEPEATDIIRTVGNPVNGVCTDIPDEQDDQQQQQ